MSRACVLPVAVDAMGGDRAPRDVVLGAVRARESGVPVVLVGDEAALRPWIPEGAPMPVVHAPDVIGMDDPGTAVRHLRDCSVRRAARLVAEGGAGAVVSCGHSGATLVAAVLELGTLDGVDRPAIGVALPTASGGRLRLVDAGASVDCRAHHLATFAALGVAWARVEGVATPRVALLANGHEAGKGSRLVREAHALLSRLPGFVGNLEPDAALAGGADVLVTDGFTGNVLLKGAEGVVALVESHLRAQVAAGVRARLGAALLAPALVAVRDALDWRRHGGALLLGARGPVVVAHGRADAEAACAAIRLAHYASQGRLVSEVDAALAALLAASPPMRGEG